MTLKLEVAGGLNIELVLLNKDVYEKGDDAVVVVATLVLKVEEIGPKIDVDCAAKSEEKAFRLDGIS